MIFPEEKSPLKLDRRKIPLSSKLAALKERNADDLRACFYATKL
jgi:hypothetical protein